MCTYVIESHTLGQHPNSEEVVFVLSAAGRGRAAVIAQCEPKTKNVDATNVHFRCQQPLPPLLAYAVALGSACSSGSNSSSNNSNNSSNNNSNNSHNNNNNSNNNNNNNCRSNNNNNNNNGNICGPGGSEYGLPQVHRMKDREWSPFAANKPYQRQC